MRILLFAAFVAVLSASTANAQKFQKGTNVLSGLIGIGSSLGAYYSSSQTPGYSVNFEHGTWQAGSDGVVSIGAYVGSKSYKYGYSSTSYSYTDKWSYTIIGVRGAYHYTGLDNDKVDLYGGLMLSYNNVSYSEKVISGSYNNSSGSNYTGTTGFTGFVGGRYFFNPKLGVNAELGYGVAYLNVGLSLKF